MVLAMQQLNIIEIEQLSVPMAALSKIFGISRRKVSDLVKEMEMSPHFKGGTDYVNLASNHKLIYINSFKRLLASKHNQYLKGV